MTPLGRPEPHESAVAHATGRARYTDDLPAPPGTLHAWPVLSPHAHARIVNVNAAAALAAPGVHAVLTAADVPGENDTGPVRHDEPLFPTEAQYCGHPVAWVVAESEALARDAAALVDVTYEPLDAILGVDQAERAESFLAGPLVMRRGDADAALARATHRATGEIRTGAQDHFYLETHASLAVPDEDGHMLVHSSTQHPSETQAVVARVLGWPRHRVTVQSLRMGGGFGGKETQANPFAAVAALAAHRTGRPVRVRLDRHHDMRITGKRHPARARYDVAFDDDGRLEALKLDIILDGGYSLDLSEAILWRAMFHADNAYFIPHVEVTGRVARTNAASNTAFRGFGGPQGMVIVEDVLDRVARHARRAPHDVRELNLYRPGQTTHYGQRVDNDPRRAWTQLRLESDLDARVDAARAFNARHPHIRRGLAITPVKFGISFTTTFLNQAGALVLVYEDGSVQVNHGGTEMGQGLHTKIRQVAAHALGVPLHAVRVMPTRTDKVPNTSATAASSGSDLNGAAVQNACDTIRERLAVVAAALLGDTHPEDVSFEDGRVHPAGRPDRALEWSSVVHAAYLQRVSLSATGYYRTSGLHFDRDTATGSPFKYYACGAAVSEVEVDGLTGEWRLVRADLLHDCGHPLNPLVDRGQLEGGFVQGMGWLTMEELVWDDAGRLRTFAPSTYKIPTIADVPEQFNVRLLEPPAGEPGAVHGSKAVGEPPFMLAISVREAIRAAVAAFGRADGEPVPLAAPSTPEAILDAVTAVRARSAPRDDAAAPAG